MIVKIEVVIMDAKNEVEALDELKKALSDRGVSYYISSAKDLAKP